MDTIDIITILSSIGIITSVIVGTIKITSKISDLQASVVEAKLIAAEAKNDAMEAKDMVIREIDHSRDTHKDIYNKIERKTPV